MLTIDDIRILYTEGEARDILNAWDELVNLLEKGDKLYIHDAIGNESMWAFAQACLDYVHETPMMDGDAPRQMELGE